MSKVFIVSLALMFTHIGGSAFVAVPSSPWTKSIDIKAVKNRCPDFPPPPHCFSFLRSFSERNQTFLMHVHHGDTQQNREARSSPTVDRSDYTVCRIYYTGKKLLQFSLDLCRRVHRHPIGAVRFSRPLKVKFCELKEKRRGCEAADSHGVRAAAFLHQRDRPGLSPCASAAFRKGGQNSRFPDALLFPW